MKIKQCYLCHKLTNCPYHITDIKENKLLISYDVCEVCGLDLIEDDHKENIDLTHVKTTEQLIDFLVKSRSKKQSKKCSCGLTDSEFCKVQKLGCPNCYVTFEEKLKKILSSCQYSQKHFGKYPKKKNKEYLKILKLQYAKALELEEYEKLLNLKKQIDEINLDCGQ